MASLATSQLALLFLILSLGLSLFTIISFNNSAASIDNSHPTLTTFQSSKSRPKKKVNVNNTNNNDKPASLPKIKSNNNNNNDVSSLARPLLPRLSGSSNKTKWDVSSVIQPHQDDNNNSNNDVSLARPLPLSASKWVKSVIQPYKNADRYVYWKVRATVRFQNLPNFQFCRWRNLEVTPQPPNKPPLPVNDTGNGKPYLLHMEIDCEQVLKKNGFGTGNWVQSMYIMRHAAAEMVYWDNADRSIPLVDLLLTCPDAAVGASKEVLPWLMGYYPLPVVAPTPKDNLEKTKEKVCPSKGSWGLFPIVWMLPLLRMELRRMAVSLVGLPQNDPDHPAHAFLKSIQEQQQQKQQQYQLSVVVDQPILPNVELDQVAIHFRCGDIMLSRHIQFRFIKFNAIVNRIDKETKSIGIVTQPFDTKHDSQARDMDHDDSNRIEICQTVTYAFVDRIRERFPHARISIRNGPEETVGLAYARLIMAKQAFTAPDSSFSVFPTLATFGVGYHIQPSKTIYPFYKNRWMLDVDAKNDPQVEFMDEPNVLSAPATKILLNTTGGATTIVEWFQNDSIHVPIIDNLDDIPK